MVAGVIGNILGLVVVKFVVGFQSDRRQYLVPQDRHGVLGAIDKLLGDHPAAVLACSVECLLKCRCVAGGCHADAGTLAAGLDENLAEAIDNSLPVGIRPEPHEATSGQANALPQLLAAQLVHGQGRAQHPGTGVGDSQRLQCALHTAVLTPGAVQGNEGKGHALQLRYPVRCCRVHGTHLKALGLQGIDDGLARFAAILPAPRSVPPSSTAIGAERNASPFIVLTPA